MLHIILNIVVVILVIVDTLLLLGVAGVGFLSDFAESSTMMVAMIVV